MGDCGAFSYIDEEIPPVTPDQVIDFYAECGFDLGISVDHVIFGFDPAADTDPHHPQARAVAIAPADSPSSSPVSSWHGPGHGRSGSNLSA